MLVLATIRQQTLRSVGICKWKCRFYSSCHSFSLLSLLLNQPSDEFETIQVTGYLFLPFPITMGIWLMQCEYKTRDNGGIFVTECNMLNKSSLFSCNSWREWWIMDTYGVPCQKYVSIKSYVIYTYSITCLISNHILHFTIYCLWGNWFYLLWSSK